jgi:hypothetical protein
MRPSGQRYGSQFRRKRQPTDSLRLLTGQQWYPVLGVGEVTAEMVATGVQEPA